MAGYPAEMQQLIDTNPGLSSRFPRTLEFPDYRTDELVAIFELIAGKQRYELVDDARARLIDVIEAYALARGGDNDFGREAIDTMVKFMEDHRDDLAVIVAGYPNEMRTLIDANPGLDSRFARTLEFPDYTSDELVAIFGLLAEKQEYHLDDEAARRLHEVIDAEPRGRGFGNARFVRNVFEQAVALHAVRVADVDAPTREQLTTLAAADIAPV